MTPIRETIQLGVDFWNDSCDLQQLAEAVKEGAVGATSNPVIVLQALRDDMPSWQPVLDERIAKLPEASEEELAWALIEKMTEKAAEILLPVYEASQGRKGFLSSQVNPQFYRDTKRMVEHARKLASLSPNIAIKIPATQAGIAAMERLTSEGIRINATVCFTISQAVACAEAVERGLASAKTQGRDTRALLPTVTIMVGRVDDHLHRVMKKEEISIDPGYLNWAGVAVFKKAHGLFCKRGYTSTLLAAAYRHKMHWTELIGAGVIQTIPYKWWKQFNRSGITPSRTIEQPMPADIQSALFNQFEDFRAAYEEMSLAPEQFESFGASRHTLRQFLSGYHQLLELVRECMLPSS